MGKAAGEEHCDPEEEEHQGPAGVNGISLCGVVPQSNRIIPCQETEDTHYLGGAEYILVKYRRQGWFVCLRLTEFQANSTKMFDIMNARQSYVLEGRSHAS